MEPEIHLLDEPLSNFDANLRKEMRFASRRFHESFGITTHYVTHDQAEAMVISVQIGSAAGANVLQRARYLGTRSIEYQVLVNGSDLVS